VPVSITTRSFAPADYDPVVRLWQQTEGVEVAEGDDRATITAYLARNPGLSRVALRTGEVVGAVLCGHDGRRGLIYHLAVAADVRGQGIGRRLIEECLAGLRTLGLKRALILVARDNELGRAFWAAQGFEEIPGAVSYGVDL
jgi:putative acetyltransferase